MTEMLYVPSLMPDEMIRIEIDEIPRLMRDAHADEGLRHERAVYDIQADYTRQHYDLLIHLERIRYDARNKDAGS